MSGGRRGGARGRGGRNKGAPELEVYSSDEDLAPKQKRPQPLFPEIDLPIPLPPSARELSAVKYHLSFRTRTRNGPFFATLDPSSIADEKTGKTLKRAGFDPFNDQETWSSRARRLEKRSVPDLEGREYALQFFPPELWSTLDPSHRSPLWKTLDSEIDTTTHGSSTKQRSLKRKRGKVLPSLRAIDDDEDTATKNPDLEGFPEDEEEATQTDDSDPLIPSTRRARTLTKSAKKRRRGRNSTTNSSREKRGLDAEDEYGPTKKKKGPSPPSSLRAKERQRRKEEARASGRKIEDDESDLDDGDDDVGEENASGEDNDEEMGDDDEDDGEPEDSEFEESDEGDADDYNAENYFDTGEGDDDDGIGFGGGGGDEGGDY